MQFDEIDVLGALSCILKSLKEKIGFYKFRGGLCSNSIIKKLSYLKKREKNVYQKHKLSHLEQHKKIYSDKYKKYCSAVSACIQSLLAWSDLQWFQYVTVLAIQGPYRGVKCLLTRFKIPLMSDSADLDSILPEFRAIVQYAVQN